MTLTLTLTLTLTTFSSSRTSFRSLKMTIQQDKLDNEDKAKNNDGIKNFFGRNKQTCVNDTHALLQGGGQTNICYFTHAQFEQNIIRQKPLLGLMIVFNERKLVL